MIEGSDARVQADRALACFRIFVCLLLLEHGTQKLFGFPPHPSGQAAPPFSLFWIGGALELMGGLACLVGVAVRPVAFVLAGEMAVAYWGWHAPNGLFPINNGGDAPILWCAIFLLFCAAGPGRLRAPSRQ